jgi:integrase/recombinase XerD
MQAQSGHTHTTPSTSNDGGHSPTSLSPIIHLSPASANPLHPVYHGRPNDMRGPADWNRYWLDRTAREISQRNYAPATRENHLSALKDFLTHHRCAPSSLRPDAIGRYLLLCKDERGLSPSTVNLILAALTFFYDHVVKAPYCIAGIPRMKEDQKLPDVLGPSSMKALIEGTANEKHRLAISMAYGCGLRVSELTRMKWTDLDFERGVLHIRKSKGAKERVVMIPASLGETLSAYRKHHQPITYVFEGALAGKPLCKRTFQAVFEKACGKAGIVRRGGIHSLRHSFATHMLEAGTDLRFIQALLGHSSVKATERYTHVNAGSVARLVSPVDRLFVQV